mmetsp:Transcript_29947/g.85562  ORF Transcript_29947/g.85562 Transcript_29947/m.85562 type:complete len:293 (-) Transcript_29947:2250-3128(-)
MKSKISLKNCIWSVPKECLESWIRFSHTLSVSHLNGFAFSVFTSKAEPALRKADTSPAVIWFAMTEIFIVTMSLNIILSRSKRPRFIYLYTWYVRKWMIFSTRFEVGWAFSEFFTEISNCPRNCSNEQLYIQPDSWPVIGLTTFVMSTMLKYMILPLVATGRNCSRFSLISILRSSASASFPSTSFALAFVLASTSISSVSSRRFPWELERRSSSCLSSCCRDLVLAVTSSSSAARVSSRLFCSMLMSLPSSCCSRPFSVTVKSMIVHLADSSGLKCGLGSRDVMYRLNFSL